MSPLSRFARAGLVVLAAGCAGPPRAATDFGLSVEPAGGDVWAWHIAVRAVARGRDLTGCRVVANAGWTEAAMDADAWRADIRLVPGKNAVVAECRDRSGALLRSPPAWFYAGLPDRPTARIRAERSTGATTLDATGSLPGDRTHAALTELAWTEDVDGRRAARPLGSGERIVVPDGPAGKPRTVRLTVRDASGAVDEAAALVQAGASGSSWIEDAVVYGVVPPLFGDPPLRSVERALPRLADLGVTVLWLTPIFESPAADFGYAVTDAFQVRRSYGTEQDLAALVKAAHHLGLYVVLDLVMNHVSSRHRYFEDAARLGRRSRYFDFFARDTSGAPTHYFDWQDLPNLNYDAIEVRRWLFAETEHWLRRVPIDGFRVDAAWAPRRRAPAFLEAWVEEVRRINPDSLLIAEAPATDPFYVAHGFDAAYDWTAELGQWAWDGLFDRPTSLVRRIDDPKAAADRRVLRFLDNNDTGPRFVTRYGRGMTRVASALLLTLPGLPCLFSGDETGAEYEPYGAPKPLDLGDNRALRDWYRRLILLRRAHPALYRGERQPLAVGPALRERAVESVAAYARRDPITGESVIVVLNFAGQPTNVSVKLPDELTECARLEDLLTARTLYPHKGTVELALPAWGVVIARDHSSELGRSLSTRETTVCTGARSRDKRAGDCRSPTAELRRVAQ